MGRPAVSDVCFSDPIVAYSWTSIAAQFYYYYFELDNFYLNCTCKVTRRINNHFSTNW